MPPYSVWKEVKDMLELLQRNLAAYAAADWPAFKADLASDVVYEEIATGRRANGADAYVDVIKLWKAAFPDSKGTIKRYFASENVGVAELEWEGAQTGALETPFGKVPATNQKVRLEAVLINKFENGKIVAVRHYFDLTTLMQQLGVIAARPTAPAEGKQAVLH
jgi:steroid delta-isomerase-like uncharacterized protein